MSGNAPGRDNLGCSGVIAVSAREIKSVADLIKVETAASLCSYSSSDEEKEEKEEAGFEKETGWWLCQWQFNFDQWTFLS